MEQAIITTAADAPTQQSTPATEVTNVKEPKTELSALEKAKMNDNREPINLDTEQLYQEFEQFGEEPGVYSETSSIQGQFWRYRFRGAVITASPEFKAALDAGTILSVVASPTVGERYVSDPNNAGKKLQQIVFGYSITFSGIEKMQKALNAKKLANEVRLSAEFQEKFQQAKTEKAIASLTPEKLKELIPQADIDALFAQLQ